MAQFSGVDLLFKILILKLFTVPSASLPCSTESLFPVTNWLENLQYLINEEEAPQSAGRSAVPETVACLKVCGASTFDDGNLNYYKCHFSMK